MPGNEQANLSLDAVLFSGTADVDIYLITGGRGDVSTSKTKLVVSAYLDVVVRLRLSGTGPRAPYHLTATSRGSSAKVQIPQDFEGILTFYAAPQHIEILGELGENVTLFKQSPQQSHYLVGNFMEWSDVEGGQDEIVIGSRVAYTSTAGVQYLQSVQ
jgi:hypothetical protein